MLPALRGPVFRHAFAIGLIALLAGLLHGMGALRPLKDGLAELRFAATSRHPTGGIVLVEVDAKSIAELGVWPWPRRIHADLIRTIDSFGPSEIAFDIDFSSSSNEADDGALEAALRDAQCSIILVSFNQQAAAASKDGELIANHPLERFQRHSWLASVNIVPDPDGQVRRYSLGHFVGSELLPSLAALLSGASPAAASFLIDFSISAHEIDRISVIDLMRGHVDAQRLKGKKIIIGASAIELRDFFQVPRHGFIPGALLQAIGAEAILQGRTLKETGLGATAAGLALMGILVFGARRLKWSVVLRVLFLLAALIEAIALGLQSWHPIAPDTSAWHVAILGFVVVVIGREIDLRKVLLIIARTEKHNVQMVLDQVVWDSFDGIVVADGDGFIRSVSRSAAGILRPGQRRDWRGRLLEEFVPARLAAAMREAVAASARGQWQAHGMREISVPHGGSGERVIEYMITPSRLRGGRTAEGEIAADRFVACLSFRDITERRLAESRLEYLAKHDTLTGLLNRNHFMERLGSFLDAAPQARGAGAVFYFDLDRFKTVNDTFSHGMGDLLLQAVAQRSLELMPAPCTLARFGGDEFAALCLGSVSTEDLDELAQRLIEHLSDPYQIKGTRLTIGVSVGIMVIGADDCDAAVVMRNADTALYRAKETGGGSRCFYEASMEAALRARQKLEVELWEALARQEFKVVYQPQFDLSSERLVGVEALVRWWHPECGLVSPEEFIPVAEQIGLMDCLGEWVLHQACKDVAHWPAAIKLAVNVSPVQFMRGDMVKTVAAALAQSGLSPVQLQLEITESLFIQEHASILSVMDKLKDSGVSFALDDFGTGYSSLSYLRKFPIDTIKIDRSFVTGVPHNQEAMAIVRAVVAMAESLRIKIVAEGLETAEQIEAFRLMGQVDGQGYGLGRPQSAEMLVDLLRADQVASLEANLPRKKRA